MTDQESFSFKNQKHEIKPSDLPPLEPTAKVPAINSDKLNDPAYWNDKLLSKTAIVPPEHRDDKHEKPGFGWKKPVAAVVGLGLAAGTAVFGYNQLSSADERPSGSESISNTDTTTVTNMVGDQITVELIDGMPYSDNNFNDVNDFQEDIGSNGMIDGFEYDQGGQYAGDVVDDPWLDMPIEALPINNDLSDAEVMRIIELGELVQKYPNAYNIIRSLSQETVDRVNQWIEENVEKFIADGNEAAISAYVTQLIHE